MINTQNPTIQVTVTLYIYISQKLPFWEPSWRRFMSTAAQKDKFFIITFLLSSHKGHFRDSVYTEVAKWFILPSSPFLHWIKWKRKLPNSVWSDIIDPREKLNYTGIPRVYILTRFGIQQCPSRVSSQVGFTYKRQCRVQLWSQHNVISSKNQVSQL